MNDNLYGTRLYINFSNLAYNLKSINGITKNCETIAMVKANAYGHGDIAMSLKMEELGVNYFGVADFEEGIRLRSSGLKGHIMVMNPGVNNIEAVMDYALEPVIYSNQILLALKNAIIKNNRICSKNPVPIHLKINTGMNRWGFNLSEIPSLIDKLKNIKTIKIKSIYSHLASSNNVQDDSFTNNQIQHFINCTLKFQNIFKYNIGIHIYNSSGLIRFYNDKNFFNYSRIGLALYGGIQDVNFKPIAELKCLVSQIRIIEKGDSVGYHRSFIAPNKMKIGLVPFGYADGLQRNWGHGMLKFQYKNKLIPTIGEISMDSCIVDLSDVENISESDEICYFGKDRPIWKLAKELRTIPYEIMATLSRRIRRIYQ
tara:strand:+ start:54 stop:1166 length:1113 start_codon:yes stop_codon:yes gene_type:complete